MSLRLQRSAGGSSEKHRPIGIVEGGARAGQYLFLTDPFHDPDAKEGSSSSSSSSEEEDEDAPSDEEHTRRIHEAMEAKGGRIGRNDHGEDRRGAWNPLLPPPKEESESGSDDSFVDTSKSRKRKRPAAAAAAAASARSSRSNYRKGVSSIQLAPDEHFLIEPTHLKGEFRDIVYLSGQSGCGKSTMIKKFCERYRRIWPKRHIVLVSALEEDSTLRTNEPPLYIQRLNLQSLVDRPVELDELQDVLLIFDDVEGMPKDMAVAVQELADLVGNRGRHQATSLLYASHLSTDYKRTRNLLMESHWYVFYPSATSAKQLVHLLSTYGGLDREQVHAARRLPSRWVALRKMYPPVIMYDGGAYILHDTTRDVDTKKLKKAIKGVAGEAWAEAMTCGSGGGGEEKETGST